jgi:hypothetical protein
MIESGYIANGTYVPGRHMLSNAYELHAPRAAAAVARGIEREADAVIRRARKGEFD